MTAMSDDEKDRTPHPAHEITKGSGLVDGWFFDDGAIITLPELVVPFLEAFDECSAEAGAERSREKTKVLILTTSDEEADKKVNPKSAIVLGAETLGEDGIVAQFRQKSEV
eukprot:5679954-Karenia_brevis.AAC.1